SGHCALEYEDTAAALAEVHRVLKPGGDAQFVLHHADSALIESARASVREADLVFTQTKVFRQLHKLVSMTEVTAQTDAATTALRASIKELKEALERARQAGAGDLLDKALDAIQKLLAARNDMSARAVGLEVDRAEAQLRGSTRQLKTMVKYSRSAADMDALEQQAARAGFSLIERTPYWHAGKLLAGWQLMLHRA
ncbi:MAG: class I SAM-dependent methyltransferase, partial [Xanthomonadales bacterium]|nr:class I SAM-dependent methyltransferase [Xanthomonadales bacterium]